MKQYKVLLESDEDGWIVATVPELPGCVSQGKTKKDALANIKEAIEGYLECLADINGELPANELISVGVHAPSIRKARLVLRA